jgi:hypothetical protein
MGNVDGIGGAHALLDPIKLARIMEDLSVAGYILFTHVEPPRMASESDRRRMYISHVLDGQRRLVGVRQGNEGSKDIYHIYSADK